MKTIEAKRVWNGKARLGEGPFWDDQEQRLLWVDIEGYKLHAYDHKHDTTETLPFAQHVTAVVKKRARWLITGNEGWALQLLSGSLNPSYEAE